DTASASKFTNTRIWSKGTRHPSNRGWPFRSNPASICRESSGFVSRTSLSACRTESKSSTMPNAPSEAWSDRSLDQDDQCHQDGGDTGCGEDRVLDVHELAVEAEQLVG